MVKHSEISPHIFILVRCKILQVKCAKRKNFKLFLLFAIKKKGSFECNLAKKGLWILGIKLLKHSNCKAPTKLQGWLDKWLLQYNNCSNTTSEFQCATYLHFARVNCLVNCSLNVYCITSVQKMSCMLTYIWILGVTMLKE